MPLLNGWFLTLYPSKVVIFKSKKEFDHQDLFGNRLIWLLEIKKASMLSSTQIVTISFISSFIGVLVLLYRTKQISPKTHTVIIGGSSGLMLAASFFSLILPGVQHFTSAEPHAFFVSLKVVAVFLFGAVLMDMIHSHLPHEHRVSLHHEVSSNAGIASTRVMNIRRAVLISAAMALHNIPEGIALGIGSLQQDQKLVRGLVLGIAAQNIPEGAMMVISLIAAGASRGIAFMGILFAASFEAIFCALAIAGGGFFSGLLGWSLMLCGGAMVYVVSQEMIPESHASGFERLATYSLMVGFGIFILLFI